MFSQLSRLFQAVSGELQRQLSAIAERVGGESGAALSAAIREETSRYQQETTEALDREVTLLAAGLELR